jgi:glycine cleavage system protein P-like pyridoxal-binding family
MKHTLLTFYHNSNHSLSFSLLLNPGEEGLKESTGMAILNANYMAKRIEEGYTVLYRGSNGQCAHEVSCGCRMYLIVLLPYVGEIWLNKTK